MFLLCQQEDKIGANNSGRSRPCHQRPRGLQTPMLRRQEESKSRGVGGGLRFYLFGIRRRKLKGEEMSGCGLMYCPDGCAITPLPPCQQINGLVLSIGFVGFFFFLFQFFSLDFVRALFLPLFQRVPIPPMAVTQDPPPVILRGAKTEEETAKTLCNQQQFHWR